jgi:hypothetical protein
LNTFIKFLGEQKLGCYSRSFIWWEIYVKTKVNS